MEVNDKYITCQIIFIKIYVHKVRRGAYSHHDHHRHYLLPCPGRRKAVRGEEKRTQSFQGNSQQLSQNFTLSRSLHSTFSAIPALDSTCELVRAYMVEAIRLCCRITLSF